VPLTNFRGVIVNETLPEAGGHLTGPINSILGAALGAQMDANAEQVLRGRAQQIPFAGGANVGRVGAARWSDGSLIECEPFMLPLLARQRGIRLWSNEPLMSQRVRVAASWQLHAGWARHEGQLRNVQPYFLGVDGSGVLPWIRIVHQSNEGTPTATWHTIDPSGVYTLRKASPSNWNWDGTPSKSSRWFAVFYLPPGYSSAWKWNDGTLWNGGPLWGGVPAAVAADLVGMLLEAKGAGSRLAGVFLTTLQPTDSIPGYPGRFAFDPNDTAIQDPAGWTSLPTGSWGGPVYTSGPYFGAGTRFPYAQLVYYDPT
jgi:hypothetical protein